MSLSILIKDIVPNLLDVIVYCKRSCLSPHSQSLAYMAKRPLHSKLFKSKQFSSHNIIPRKLNRFARHGFYVQILPEKRCQLPGIPVNL